MPACIVVFTHGGPVQRARGLLHWVLAWVLTIGVLTIFTLLPSCSSSYSVYCLLASCKTQPDNQLLAAFAVPCPAKGFVWLNGTGAQGGRFPSCCWLARTCIFLPIA